MDIIQILEDIKLKAIRSEIEDVDEGICSKVNGQLAKFYFNNLRLDHIDAFYSKEHVMDELEACLIIWDYFSGDPSYPVGGIEEYGNENLWVGKHYQARLLLLDHLIECAEEGLIDMVDDYEIL